MKLVVNIGNPKTEEWETKIDVELESYADIFSRKHPNIPVLASFEEQLSVEDHKIELWDIGTIDVMALYSPKENWFNLTIKKDGFAFCQVSCPALNQDSVGASAIFVTPGTNFPVEVRLDALTN